MDQFFPRLSHGRAARTAQASCSGVASIPRLEAFCKAMLVESLPETTNPRSEAHPSVATWPGSPCRRGVPARGQGDVVLLPASAAFAGTGQGRTGRRRAYDQDAQFQQSSRERKRQQRATAAGLRERNGHRDGRTRQAIAIAACLRGDDGPPGTPGLVTVAWLTVLPASSKRVSMVTVTLSPGGDRRDVPLQGLADGTGHRHGGRTSRRQAAGR